MSYLLYPNQYTMLGLQHGEVAVRNSSAETRGRFRRQALKIEKESDRANYLTALASMTADGIGSSWASFYELCVEIEESGVWRHLEPREGTPPKSYDEWRDVMFKEKIIDWVALEATYRVMKTHYPAELHALNLDDAVARLEKLQREHEQIRSIHVVQGQEMLDLYGERMEPEKRQELEAKVEKGEKVTQQEVADAAGVDQRTVGRALPKNVQQNGIRQDPPPSTLELRRVGKLLQIDGMEERIKTGESLRKLAVEAGIEKPSLCLPRSPEKAAANILRDFGDNAGWLKTVAEALINRELELRDAC